MVVAVKDAAKKLVRLVDQKLLEPLLNVQLDLQVDLNVQDVREDINDLIVNPFEFLSK